MTVFIDYTTGFPCEIPCPACGWPMYCCLCEADDLKENEQYAQQANGADAESNTQINVEKHIN